MRSNLDRANLALSLGPKDLTTLKERSSPYNHGPQTEVKPTRVETPREQKYEGPPLKVMVCGDKGAGKTTFLKDFWNEHKVFRVIRNAGANIYHLVANLHSNDNQTEHEVSCEFYEVQDEGALINFPKEMDLAYLVFDLTADRALQFNLRKWVVQLKQHFPKLSVKAFANKVDLQPDVANILTDIAGLNGVLGQARIPVEAISARDNGYKCQ